MKIDLGSSPVVRNFVFAAPLCATAWLATSPGVLTPSSLVALAGFVIALGWLARTTYHNDPPMGLAPLLHGTARRDAAGRQVKP